MVYCFYLSLAATIYIFMNNLGSWP